MQHRLINTNTSHFTNQSQKLGPASIGATGQALDSLDNASYFTSRHDKKRMQELRKEIILIFRFFCLDKQLIGDLLKGPTGSIAKEGYATFTE